MKFTLCFFLAAIGCSLASTAFSQSIVWQPSVDLIAGGDNSDFISQTGNFVVGFNGGTTAVSTTIGDSVFTSATSGDLVTGVTANGVTVTGTFNSDTGGGTFGTGEFDNADVGALLGGAVFDGVGGTPNADGTQTPGTIAFSGLTAGNDYEIQIITNDARGGTNAGIRDVLWQLGVTNGVDDNISGIANITNRPENDGTSPLLAGDFLIGTFTADGTTQSFNIGATRAGFSLGDTLVNVNGGQSQINAFQLRDLSASVVPEPSSLAVIGLGFVGFVARRRRN